MGLLDFLKKKEVRAEKQPSSACLGVLDIFELKGKDQLLLLADLKGSLQVGDRVQVCHPDQSMDSLGELEVLELADGQNRMKADTLTDDPLASVIVKRSELAEQVKKGSVLHTRDISVEDRLFQYTQALFRSFVTMQAGEMTDKDIARASLDDCIEILRLFLWHCQEHHAEDTEERHQENLRKIRRLEGIVRDKLLATDAIYVYYSQLTGEPYLFSQTIDRGEQGYLCTDPKIYIFTRRWYENFKKELASQPNVEIREIKNTSEANGILNFLGDTFYLNGALGAMFNTDQVVIRNEVLVAKPDLSAQPEIQVPVMNPDLVRWLLLMGQLGEVDTEGKKLDYGLYYGFFTRELPKARLLVPMKKGEDFPNPEQEEAGQQLVLQQNSSLYLPTRKGKEDRLALQVFTDWKRLRMVFDEEWSALVESEGSMIEKFDYILNWTGQEKGGAYVSQETYQEAKERWD